MRSTLSLRIFAALVLAALASAPAPAQTLDLGPADDDGIPALVKHLPDWESARARSVYATKPEPIRAAVPDQPALEAVSFGGGTEAVAADYAAAGRLVIVEFSTPQIAADNDARIRRRVEELRAAGGAAPSVYRRVGNYSVFVFGASDVRAAEELAGRVRYEKDVRWLGTDPHANERANRAWINMSASVIVNTVKATGVAIALCLGVGLTFGTVIFRRRRAALASRYSDAGGMMRLDLDDNTTRLLGQGEK
jgi:hypothetical protein